MVFTLFTSKMFSKYSVWSVNSVQVMFRFITLAQDDSTLSFHTILINSNFLDKV